MLSNIISRDDHSGRFDRNTAIPIGILNAVIRVETLFGWLEITSLIVNSL